MTKRPVQSSMPEAAPDHEEAQDVTFYTALLGSLPGMAYRMLNKPDWPAEFISEGSLALTGYASADLTIGGKHTYNELIHPDDREYVWQGVQAAVALHQPYRLTYRIHTADGTMKWVNEQGSGVYAGDGSLLFLTGFITDITERQEAEEAKRTSQQMLQNVLAHFPGVVFWKDQNSVYLGCNQAFATGAGLATPADIVGKTDYDLPWAHTEADAYRADDQQVMAGGVPKLHIIETQYQADGNVVWFDTSKIPLLDEDGHVIGVLGTSTDITTLKQSEAEQERYAERLSVASEIAGKAQTILDPDTLLQAVIPLIKERFGLYYVHVYTVDEAAGELKLRAGYGEPGRIMVEQGHSIPLNHEQSLVATAARTKEVVLVNDVTKNPNFLPNPLLPDTKSEVAVPAIAGGKVLGVFDVQHDVPGYFTQADLDVFQALTGQIATALQNAQLYTAAETSAARNRALLQTIPDMMFVFDQNGVFLDFKAEAGQELLAPPEIFLGKPVTEILPPQIAEPTMEYLQQVLATGTEVIYEYQAPAGETLHDYEARMSRVSANQALAIVRDITERKWAEAALRLTRTSIEQSRDAYFWFDGEARFIDVSQTTCTVLGYSREELLQMRVFDVDPVFPVAGWGDLKAQVKAAGSMLFESQHRTREGRLFPVEVTVSYVQVGDQDVYFSIARDITERKQAEAERERYTERLSVAAEIAARVQTILDPDELLRAVIPLIKERFGLYYVHVYTLEGETLRLRAGYGEPGRIMVEQGHSIPLTAGQSLVARAARTQQVVTVADVTQAPDFLPNPLLPDTKSEVAVPAIAGGKVLGVFDVQHDMPGYFTQADLDVFQALAGQIATALQNAQLYTAAETSAARNRALLQTIPDMMFVFDQNGVFLDFKAEAGQELLAPPELFLGKPVTEILPPQIAEPTMEYLQQVLATGTEVIYEYQAPAGETLHDYEARMSRVSANQALAIVRDITERKWAEAERERFVTQLKTAAEISAQVSSILDTDELLKKMVPLLKERFNLYHVQFYLMDEDRHELTLRAGYGQVGQIMQQQGFKIDLDQEQSLVARAARSRQIILANDVTQDPDFMPNLLLPDTRAEVAVPAIIGEQLIGILDVQASGTNYFTESDLDVYRTLASQIANAFQGAQLFGQQRQAEKAQREAAEKIRAMFDAMTEGITVTNMIGTIEDLNEAMLRLYGYHRREELLGRSSMQLFARPFWSKAAENVRQALEAGASQATECRMVRHDGSEFEAETSAALLRDINGAPTGFVTIIRDITARKWAEEERVRMTTQLRTAADISAQATTLLDPQLLLRQVVTLIKERFDLYHVHFYTLDETTHELLLAAGYGDVGKTMLAQDHRLQLEAEKSLVARAARTQTPLLVADTTTSPDFMLNPLLPDTRSEIAVPLVLSGKTLGVLDVQHNRAHRFTEADLDVFRTLAGQLAAALQNARYFEELQRAAERLREVDRMKSEFLANMSHELRTPLNSIIGYAEVMLMGIDGEMAPETLEDIQAIYENGQHLLTMINDILDLAKIESGRMALKMEPVEVEQLLDEMRSSGLGLLRKYHKENQVELSIEAEANLPLVSGDRIRLNQILNNLLSNAVKFTEHGSIQVRAYRQDNHVCISVRDTGIGIASDQLEKIFEKFQQVDGSAKRRAEGTGLGLAITRYLVEMHGGTISVHSVEKKGSVFTVSLPMFSSSEAPKS